MKATIVAASLLGAVAMASPTEKHPESYGKYDHYGDYKNVDYKQPPKQEAPKGYGGWGKGKGDCHDSVLKFTSTFKIVATPEQVVNNMSAPTGGQPGAIGYYNFGLNSETDQICYHIRLEGVQGEYQSAANTATHIHNAARGAFGPPRVAIPNPMPTGEEGVREGQGCLTGPFETGSAPMGTDTGAGFTVAQLEANPGQYYADFHTNFNAQTPMNGNVRGQFA